MSVLGLSRAEARRIAVRAQLLDANRPPMEQRRWGYFALPVLHQDRLVGKVDASADRRRSVLAVHAIHEDVRFTRTLAAALRAELEALASWLALDKVVIH